MRKYSPLCEILNEHSTEMKAINILILGSFLVSCNSQEKKSEQVSSEQGETKKVAPINCYRYASNSDTITLKVIHVGNSITGTLVYRLKEKDKNKGTIQGEMKGDILVADYTFTSEGTQSIRQIAFKLEGNSFVEGYGDIVTNNNKIGFKNLDSLRFNPTMKLTEIDCQ